MASIAGITSDLEFGRSQILEAMAGLSKRELTEIPLHDDGGTVKDVLAHLIGWDEWVADILPLIVQNRADDIPPVEVEAQNQKSMAAWLDKPLREVLLALQASHQHVIELLTGLDYVEIDLRRERQGQTITIRSYMVDLLVEHDREHAHEIKAWRETLAEVFEPEALKAMLAQQRADFMTALDRLNGAQVLDKTAIGHWSVKDLVGHIADWESYMLQAAQHIYDPSLPPAAPAEASEDVDACNEVLAAKREGQAWAEVRQSLKAVQTEVAAFVDKLKPGDWNLRGPYPWPHDHGTLAELIFQMADHYADHLPDVSC